MEKKGGMFKVISWLEEGEKEKIRAGKRKKKRPMITTEKPKKLVMSRERYPRRRGQSRRGSLFFLIALKKEVRVRIMRKRYVRRPMKPELAKKLRYSL